VVGMVATRGGGRPAGGEEGRATARGGGEGPCELCAGNGSSLMSHDPPEAQCGAAETSGNFPQQCPLTWLPP
jgi:hypothetical protein